MSTTIEAGIGQTEKLWDVAVDVSKATLDWYAEDGVGRGEQGQVANTNAGISAWLNERTLQARALGFDRVRVICEPTGGYEKRLLHLTRHAGCATALVSGEAVSQLRVVESNDTGKSDEKDPRTILLLVKWRKTLTDRVLAGEWRLLRERNARYDRLERESTQAKNRIHKLLVPLFGALSFKNDWLFESTASAAVCELYGFNAAAILADGRDKLRNKLRRRGVYRSTIRRLWDDAQASALPDADPTWLALLADDLRELFADLAQVRARMQRTREHMIGLVDTLRDRGETRLQAHPQLISPFLLSRILAETGPLREFSCIQKLWRYGGLNLRPYESGEMRGQPKQSKRGRARLRHVLAQAVLKRVVRGELYGEYYHAKRAGGKCGGKAMTAVVRKFLKLLHGLDKSGGTFDPQRVFHSDGAAIPPTATAA
jgi:transposase